MTGSDLEGSLEREQDEAQRLMRSASAGDAEAVERLLQAHLPALQGYLRRHAGHLVAGKESSSDLVQSVCREALKGLAEQRLEYRSDAEFKQWLYQAALLKLMKKQRYYGAEMRDARAEASLPVDAAPNLGEISGREETPSQISLREEQAGRIQALLHRLPPRFEQVIRLAYFEGLAHEEIALRMGIEAGHSRVLLSRAKSRLAKLCLEERGFTAG